MTHVGSKYVPRVSRDVMHELNSSGSPNYLDSYLDLESDQNTSTGQSKECRMCSVLRGQSSSNITLGMSRAMVAVTMDNAQ